MGRASRLRSRPALAATTWRSRSSANDGFRPNCRKSCCARSTTRAAATPRTSSRTSSAAIRPRLCSKCPRITSWWNCPRPSSWRRDSLFSRIALAFALALAFCTGQDDPVTRARTQAVSPAEIPGGIYMGPETVTFGAPITGAPFSADIVDEVLRTLPNGNRMHKVIGGRIYRDREGRVRREFLIPAAKGQIRTFIMIADPVALVSWYLDTEQKTAHKMPAPPLPDGTPARAPQTILPDVDAAPKHGEFRTESLGTQMIDGISCIGARSTITVPAGA